MITEKVSDNQKKTVTLAPVDNYMGDSVYSAESSACSDNYRVYLDGLLHDQGVAVSETDFEDAMRYQSLEQTETPVAAEHPAEFVEPKAPAAPQKEETETVRVFNQKRAVWLIVYILLAIGVVLALLFTMPGTAWERKTITVSTAKMYPVAEAAETVQPEASINAIYTLSGEKVMVELSPYAEEKPQTNWFDRLCDWLNNAVGG